MSHYCDGCEHGGDHEHDEDWCCGGDGSCDAMQDAPDCAADPTGGHRWTKRETGGCDSNPGVWSMGGTTYRFDRRCILCGMRERVTAYGWQRDPGRCDSRRYSEGVYPVDEAEAADEMRRRRRNWLARQRYHTRRRAVIAATGAAGIEVSR